MSSVETDDMMRSAVFTLLLNDRRYVPAESSRAVPSTHLETELLPAKLLLLLLLLQNSVIYFREKQVLGCIMPLIRFETGSDRGL